MTARLLVERQEKPSERVLSPRAIEVDLLRAVRTNRLKERLIARQWFQTGPSIPAIPVSSDSPPSTSGIHDQWHLASVFSHRHLFSHRPLSIVNHMIMVQPTPPKQTLPCPCQIEAIPQSFSHLGLRLSLPASAIRLRNDQKAQFTHIKLDRQALHSPRDDLHKICFYSQLTTGFHSSRAIKYLLHQFTTTSFIEYREGGERNIYI